MSGIIEEICEPAAFAVFAMLSKKDGEGSACGAVSGLSKSNLGFLSSEVSGLSNLRGITALPLFDHQEV